MSNIDLSFLDDSSSDEGDDLLQIYRGRSALDPKPGEPKPKSVESTTRLPSLTQSSVESEEAAKKKESQLTPAQIETKAQKIANSLKLHTVQRVTDMARIGWRRTSKALEFYFSEEKSRRPYHYPCLLLDNDEYYLMFGMNRGLDAYGQNTAKSSRNAKVGVKYLGWTWKMAASCEEVVQSTFVPYTAAKSETENEDLLEAFLEAVFGEKDGDFALERRTEELVIKASWEKVKKQQMEAQTAAEEEGPKIDGRQTEQPKSSPNIEPTDRNNESESSDDDGIEQYDSDEEGGSQKRVVLRPGDIIEYYDPIGVAGKKEWLRNTEIIGINFQNKNFPLNLRDGAYLSPDHPIKRLVKIYRGKLMKDTEGRYRAVRNYSLRSSGTTELIAFKERVDRIKGARQSHAESMDQFWEDRAVDNGCSQVQQSTEETSKSSKSSKSSHRGSLARPSADSNSQNQSKPTNRRKRQKQDLAASLSNLQSRDFLSLSTHLERTARELKANHGRSKSASSVTDEQRTTASNSRGSICNLAESNRKRRKSGISSTTAAARSTALKVKATRQPTPAYEPPSVKRKRKSTTAPESTKKKKKLSTEVEQGRRTTRESFVMPTPKDRIEEHKKSLQRCIDDVRAKEGRRRYTPHLTIQQLQLGMKVWDCLDTTVKTEVAISDLSVELEVPHRKLTCFLQGDHREPYMLSDRVIQELVVKLEDWVKKDSLGP